MAWGEAARAAVEKATEAWKKGIQLETKLASLIDSVIAFESRISAQLTDFKLEINTRTHNEREALRTEVRSLEARLRESEGKLQRLEALLAGKVGDAIADVVKERALQQNPGSSPRALATEKVSA